MNIKAPELVVAVQMIYRIDEAGKLQERDGHAVVGGVGGRFFQAHHFGAGLNMGRILAAHGGQRGVDGQGQSMARLQWNRVNGAEIDASQTKIFQYPLTL